MRRSTETLDAKQITRVIKLYTVDKLSIPVLATRFGVHAVTIKRTLEDNGVPIDSKRRANT